MKNIKSDFYNSKKEQAFLEHLDDRDEAFWDSLSFLNELNNIGRFDNEDVAFYQARFLITGRLINHIASAYHLLKMGLEDECLIMYRQSLENSWLLKYFIQKPNHAREWMDIEKPKNIRPKQRRKILENEEAAERIYSKLSSVVHSNHKSFWGVCVGGMFNHVITDELFGHLIATVNESIQYFTEIMNLFHTTIEETEHAELYKEISLKLGMCIYITSYFKDPNRTISMLKKNGEDDVIRYLKSNYKRV